MKATPVDPPGLASPVGPYSYGLKVSGEDLLFIAGCTASDETGQIVAPGDVTKQTEQIFENIGKILGAIGGDFRNIVRLGLYITDTKEYGKVSEVRKRYFKKPYPVSTCIGVAGFVEEGAVIEIDAVAILDRDF